MRKYSDSEFQKQIRISDELYEKIKKTKGKKSAAGKLKEIVEYYYKMHNLNNL